MSVWKQGNSYRYKVIRNGRVVSGSARTRKEAEALEAQGLADLVAERIGAPTKRTLEQAFTHYFTSPEALNLKSIGNLASKADQWTPYFRGRPITAAVEVADEATRAWHAAGLKPATINRRLALLRRILNLAYRRWKWLGEPLADRIPLLPGEEPREIYLDRAQAVRLRRAIRNHVARAWISLLVYSGLRIGELENLTAEQIRDGVIYLTSRTKTSKPRAVPLLGPGARYARFVPLAIGYQALRRYYEPARAAIGMPHLRLHDLRHTTAAWLAQAGAETRDLQVWLGHTNPATTARYAHLNLDRMKAVAQKLHASHAKAKRTQKV